MKYLVVSCAAALSLFATSTGVADDSTKASDEALMSLDPSAKGYDEPNRYCVCLHQECETVSEIGYIMCRCIWMSCVDLDMRPV